MATGNFQPCLDQVLKIEGGYVDDPRGGPTNLGVTLPALQTWYGQGHVATVADIQALTPASVAPIYKAGFWNAVHADYLPKGVDLFVFDTAVNSGPGRAARMLQEALGVVQDGLVGPNTINAAAAASVAALIAALVMLRRAYVQAIHDPDDIDGWLNRIEIIEQAALSMAQ